MSGPETLLARFGLDTVAQPTQVNAVAERVRRSAAPVEAIQSALDELPSAHDISITRVRQRVSARRIRPQPAAPYRSAALMGAAAAAAVLLIASMAANPPGTRIDSSLASREMWAQLDATENVQLTYRGNGTLHGVATDPRIDWEVGTLTVDVEPEKGVRLLVATREAEVRVVGTHFSVTRDALGTTVRVQHGRVVVTCAAGENLLLGGGESSTCLPISAAGLLGRSRALSEQGAATDMVVASINAGLAASPTTVVRDELLLVQVESLAQGGLPEAALATANAALLDATTRREELHRLASGLSLRLSGCGAALPHLQVLSAGAASGPELVQYADCIAGENPTSAITALQRALASGPPEDQAREIQARLAALGQ